MEKVQISKLQFAVLMIMTILGDDKISGIFGAQLKQDKLYALFISLIISICIFTMYYIIFKNVKFMGFFKTFEFLFGKFLGRFILLLYAVYFIFLAILDARDIIQFVSTYLLDKTPPLFIRSMYLFLIYYTLINGLEVLARVAQILFVSVIFIFISFSILTIAANEPHLESFFPIFEYGIKPLIIPILVMSVSIPLGNYFVMMVIFQHIKDKKKLLRAGIIAQMISGFIIIIVFVLNLLVLSPETLHFMLSPVLRIARRIDIDGFFQRLDLVTLLILIIISYVKTGVLIYAGKECISHVFKINKDALIYFLICIFILLGTIFIFPDYILLLKFESKYIMLMVDPFFEFVLPFTIFILSFLKK